MRAFYSSASAVMVLTLIALVPSSALAGWSVDGATIRATTSNIPLVSGCSDGGYGTFVAWQEESSPGQPVLRVQHVLSTGDVDPAWPADGVVAAGNPMTRAELGMLPDRDGGVYLWWKEDAALFVNRLDGGGASPEGWSGGAIPVGNVYSDSPRPSVIEDGAHGLYLAWSSPLGASGSRPILVHLSPSGDESGGDVGPPAINTTRAYYPQVALAPDGGAFVAWGTWSPDASKPREWRLRRLDASGANVSGWPTAGLSKGAFNREVIPGTAQSAILGLSPDGRGGVFLLRGVLGAPSSPEYPPDLGAVLERFQGDGQPALDWPAGGANAFGLGIGVYLDAGAEGSFHVLSDAQDGALVGMPEFHDHGTFFAFHRLTPTGSTDYFTGARGKLTGYEYAPKSGGGLFLGSFNQNGPYQYYDYDAFLAVTQSPADPGWTDFYEDHGEILQHWFGDIGLAPTGDGGSVLFWSQAHDRFGLFARRFTSSGEVTGVPPAAEGPLAIHSLRFARGAGIRARVTLPNAGPATLGLFDVAGRRHASLDLSGRVGTMDLVLPGTESVRSGIYFARLDAGPASARGRVMVLR